MENVADIKSQPRFGASKTDLQQLDSCFSTSVVQSTVKPGFRGHFWDIFKVAA
jgi:hypothetical protein